MTLVSLSGHGLGVDEGPFSPGGVYLVSPLASTCSASVGQGWVRGRSALKRADLGVCPEVGAVPISKQPSCYLTF